LGVVCDCPCDDRWQTRWVLWIPRKVRLVSTFLILSFREQSKLIQKFRLPSRAVSVNTKTQRPPPNEGKNNFNRNSRCFPRTRPSDWQESASMGKWSRSTRLGCRSLIWTRTNLSIIGNCLFSASFHFTLSDFASHQRLTPSTSSNSPEDADRVMAAWTG
jgi:hypothetical protein